MAETKPVVLVPASTLCCLSSETDPSNMGEKFFSE